MSNNVKVGDTVIKFAGDYRACGVVVAITEEPPRYLVKVTKILQGNLLMVYAPHQVRVEN